MSLKEKLSIMVVDDMATSRSLIMQSLDDLGLKNVDYCSSGDEAFKRVATRPVHLVISDFNMPGMNGLQLLKSLRGYARTQKIGFILITGTPTPEVIDTGKRLRMNNYIKKPFTVRDMKNCIESVVGRL